LRPWLTLTRKTVDEWVELIAQPGGGHGTSFFIYEAPAAGATKVTVSNCSRAAISRRRRVSRAM
jgi:hypothetical protein